ncbi:MAG: hypothetical protein RR585_06795 [Coprobacillus sp.]
MGLFNDVQEKRARLGMGSALYSNHFNTEGKFQFLIPTAETPFIASDISEVEVKVSASSVVTKLAGVETLNAAETTVYMHRDCIRLLEKLNGKTIELISMAGDFTGYRYSATVSYTPTNATMDDAWQGTIKLTPKTKPIYIDNCYPLIVPTAFFESDIDSMVELQETTGIHTVDILTKPSDATVVATSEDSAIATATMTAGRLTITGKKEGSTVVTLKTTKEGFATWETSILVIVPKAVTAVQASK